MNCCRRTQAWTDNHAEADFMILFAVFVTSWAIYCSFSDWQQAVRRYFVLKGWRPRSKRQYPAVRQSN